MAQVMAHHLRLTFPLVEPPPSFDQGFDLASRRRRDQAGWLSRMCAERRFGRVSIQGASEVSGLPAKTIRYYEIIGLVVADRQSNGYRSYAVGHLRRLSLVRRARSLGFSVDTCRDLLSLYEDQSHAGSEAKALADACLAEIDRKVDDLGKLRVDLARLVKARCDAGGSGFKSAGDFLTGTTRHN